MQVRNHVAASIIVSAVTYALSDSAVIATVALVSGIFIDADHLIDYIVLHRPPYSIKDFFDRYANASRLTHALLVLHSWDLLGLWALIVIASDWEPAATGLLIGIGHHLLLDQIFNHPYPFGYFLSFRLYTRLSFARSFRSHSGAKNTEKGI